MNKACLSGRLTADPELKQTQSGISVVGFTVAVNRRFKDESGNYGADFINIVAWRNTAEFVCKYFGKGDKIEITGSIQTRNYEDKNGNKRTAFEVVAESVEFGESKGNKQHENNNDNGSNNSSPAQSFNKNDYEDVETPDEDLPF